VDRCRDENPLSVIDADERKLQQPAKALLRAKIRVIAPSDVGERADRNAQAGIARSLPWAHC
jgi:hypothetical protein